MKQQNGQLTTITKVVLSILLILGLMLGIAGLNILVQNHTTVSERENQQQATRLDIALVNEDKPVVVGKTVIISVQAISKTSSVMKVIIGLWLAEGPQTVAWQLGTTN